jgi:CrcB protein
MSVIYVAVGGALGAVARYGLTGWVQAQVAGGFPWGTMVVNVLGSFLLGASVAWLATSAVTPETREFVSIGLLGAFTTFSTFTYETVEVVEREEKIQEVLPELDEMIGGGLITLERARVIMYRPEEEGRPYEEMEAPDEETEVSDDEEGRGR